MCLFNCSLPPPCSYLLLFLKLKIISTYPPIAHPLPRLYLFCIWLCVIWSERRIIWIYKNIQQTISRPYRLVHSMQIRYGNSEWMNGGFCFSPVSVWKWRIPMWAHWSEPICLTNWLAEKVERQRAHTCGPWEKQKRHNEPNSPLLNTVIVWEFFRGIDELLEAVCTMETIGCRMDRRTDGHGATEPRIQRACSIHWTHGNRSQGGPCWVLLKTKFAFRYIHHHQPPPAVLMNPPSIWKKKKYKHQLLFFWLLALVRGECNCCFSWRFKLELLNGHPTISVAIKIHVVN